MAYGLWLTPKGRVWGDSFVLKASPTQLWVMSEGLTGVALRERLEAYVVADDVVIEDASAQAHALVMAGLDDPVRNDPGCDPQRSRAGDFWLDWSRDDGTARVTSWRSVDSGRAPRWVSWSQPDRRRHCRARRGGVDAG